MNHPEISIVIRTFNEEKFLSGLLKSLEQQSFRDFETIVVDSGSIDRTRDIADHGADKLLRIESYDFTFGHSLNVGIQEASGKYVVIASAHTLPVNEQWLSKLIDPLQEKQIAMVYGRQLGAKSSKFSEIQDMRRTFGSRRKVLKPPRFFANNANSAIRKDLWQEHPFDESLLGLEDIEWAKYWMERGYEVLYEPQAALFHIHQENWRQIRRRYYREAVAARWIGIKSLRHALATPIIESARLLLDFGHILFTGNDEYARSKNFQALTLDNILFRANKSIGTMKGLFDGGIMENPNAREKILFDRTCQAVVIHGPRRAVYEKIEIPAVKPGDVLVRVAYEGVCATDLEIFDGTLSYYKDGLADYPIVPGHEFSGHVVIAGSNVNHLHRGDPVVVECIQSCGICSECRKENFIGCQKRTELGVIGRNGGYSEFVVVPGRFVHRLPLDFDLRKACLCEPLAVVIKGLKRLERMWPSSDSIKRCAVVGAGPLGHLCAHVLAMKGHFVKVFDRNPKRLQYLRNLNIEVSEELAPLEEFDTLVEVTGDPDALNTILNMSPAGATILLLGLPYAHRKFTFESIVAFDKIVIGSVGSGGKDFEEAIALLSDLETTAIIEKTLPLSEFMKAWELVRLQKYLKIILEIK